MVAHLTTIGTLETLEILARHVTMIELAVLAWSIKLGSRNRLSLRVLRTLIAVMITNHQTILTLVSTELGAICAIMMHLAMSTLWNRAFIAEVLTNCCAPLAFVRGKSFTFLRIMLLLAEGASWNRAITRLMLANYTTIVARRGGGLVTNQNLVMLTAGFTPVLCIIDAVLGLMTKSLTILTLPALFGSVTPTLTIGARATVSLIMSSLVAGFTCQLGEALVTVMTVLIADIA
jgi:hypothetical protein